MFTRLANKTIIVIPPPPPKFTLKEWYLNNREKYRISEDSQQCAERILVENIRLKEKSAELADINKRETNHAIDERIHEIEFQTGETERQRKDVCLELEAIMVYKERIIDAMNSIKSEGLRICQKCLIMREGRVGIDLVVDDVEKELLKEIDIIKGAQMLLQRTLEEANEQTRRLRSLLYFIDHDLENKQNVLKIDRHNKGLTEKSLCLSTYHGTRPLDISNITAEEWKSITDQNYYNAAKQISSAVGIRSYIDTLLKQIVEDIQAQYHTCNEAFRRRIEETKECKAKMENQHYETTRLTNEVIRNITEIEKAIAEKEGYLALAHTRMGNRCLRPGLELCRDVVESTLAMEVSTLVENIAQLQLSLAEAQASLRYLLRTQTQLEQDINIKTNTLKIDEVDCMTIRLGMDFHAY